MRVVWHPQARKARDEVAEYIKQYFGTKRKMRFLQDVRQTTKMLKISPNIGRIDPLFNDIPFTCRSVIINGLNKMVYYIENETINIAAFWDTRMDDKEQAKQAE